MKAGTGYSNMQESFKAGKYVAQTALENGGIKTPDLLMAFCNSSQDAEEFFNGVKEVVGTAPVIGGSAIGIITNDNISYEGYPAGALALQSEKIAFEISSVKDLNKDEYKAGSELGKFLPPSEKSKLFFLLYDSIKKAATPSSPPIMNASRPLIAGIEKHLHSKVPIIGAGVLGDYDFRITKQFCGDHVASQCSVGMMLSGDFEVYHTVMHGCTPLDGNYFTITKKEGPFIYEINGVPACELIDKLYGSQEWRNQMPVNLLTIGVNRGEKYADFAEGNYVNRLITGALPDGKGICLFEPDLDVGSEIQFMLRDALKIIESAKENTERIFEQIKADKRQPYCGIYIDCAGRVSILSHTQTEEASEVQRMFKKKNIPLLGFYSGVEIAPLHGKSLGLDWTGILTVLTE